MEARKSLQIVVQQLPKKDDQERVLINMVHKVKLGPLEYYCSINVESQKVLRAAPAGVMDEIFTNAFWTGGSNALFKELEDYAKSSLAEVGIVLESKEETDEPE